MTKHLSSLVLAMLLDMLLSSARRCLRPEKGIKTLHELLGKKLRGAAGAMALLLPFLLTLGICWLCDAVHPALGVCCQAVICWQLMGVRSLWLASARVYRAMERGNLPAACRITGLDSSNEETVVRKVMELNIAEFPRRVFAPVLCMLLGGAPLAVLYLAAHALGGRAKKAADWLPCKLGGVLLCACAPAAGMDGGNAFRIFMRDGDESASACMAAAAGAMHLQLASSAHPGKVGNNDRPPEKSDLPRLNRYMFTAMLALPAVIAVIEVII